MNIIKSVKFILLSLILLITSSAFAQEKQKIPAEFFEELLQITEKHLLSEFTFENTLKYKLELQQLIGKILEEYPEYKKHPKFKKLFEITDEYLQKKFSHETTLEYCRELSKFILDILEELKWRGKITIKQEDKLAEIWDMRVVTAQIELIQGKAQISEKVDVYHLHLPDEICPYCFGGLPNPMTKEIPPITFSALLKFQDENTLVLESLCDYEGEFVIFPILLPVKYRDLNTIKIEEEKEIVLPSKAGTVVKSKYKIMGELYKEDKRE